MGQTVMNHIPLYEVPLQLSCSFLWALEGSSEVNPALLQAEQFQLPEPVFNRRAAPTLWSSLWLSFGLTQSGFSLKNFYLKSWSYDFNFFNTAF